MISLYTSLKSVGSLGLRSRVWGFRVLTVLGFRAWGILGFRDPGICMFFFFVGGGGCTSPKGLGFRWLG